jgi:phosphoadenosine phosphosulfate reductase
MQTELAIIERALANQPACFTCSFQAEDVALLHLLRQVEPNIPVLFLDTGYHFPSVIEYRDRLAAAWNLNLVNLASSLTVAQQESQFGILYQSEPSRCCNIRKVEPLFSALSNYETWFTGLRREQSPTRANLQPEELSTLPSGKPIHKISPLALWTWNEVWAYLRVNEIPHAPLYDEGYTSIGCAPCTAKPSDPVNLRSGRWGGAKLECGIHTNGN